MPEKTPGRKYLGTVILVVAVGLLGFGAFLSYLQLDMASFAGSGLLLLAVAAGTASFFSPCSFPLLVTLLARETGSDNAEVVDGSRTLGFAAAFALGASLFLLLLGAVIAAGAGSIVGAVTFTSTTGRILRLLVGALLALLGILQMRGVRFSVADLLKRPLSRAQAKLRRRSRNLGFGLFGFGYVLAGFG